MFFTHFFCPFLISMSCMAGHQGALFSLWCWMFLALFHWGHPGIQHIHLQSLKQGKPLRKDKNQKKTKKARIKGAKKQSYRVLVEGPYFLKKLEYFCFFVFWSFFLLFRFFVCFWISFPFRGLRAFFFPELSALDLFSKRLCICSTNCLRTVLFLFTTFCIWSFYSFLEENMFLWFLCIFHFKSVFGCGNQVTNILEEYFFFHFAIWPLRLSWRTCFSLLKLKCVSYWLVVR